MIGQAMGPLSVSGEASSAAVEPPDSEPEGPVFVEMDPSGRFGRVRHGVREVSATASGM